MGFLDQFRQHPQQAANNPNNLIQSIIGGQQRITLPNGQSVNFQEFQAMMQGKTPEEGFAEMGLDYSNFSHLL